MERQETHQVNNLLFLSHRIPYPPDKGEKIRAWHMFCHLAQTHRLHLGCFIDDDVDWEHLPKLRDMCADIACFALHPRIAKLRALLRMRPGRPMSLGYFHDARLQQWVKTKLADPAIKRVFVYSSGVAHYAIDAVRQRRILDFVDVDSSKWAAYANEAHQPMRGIFERERRTLLAFERRAATHYDHSLFVSEHEWKHFLTLAPECTHNTGWITNGVDLAHFSPELAFDQPFEPSGSDVVFTARMDYRPNIDAATWFARSVLPELQVRRPGVRFWIVGAAPTTEVRRLAALPGVAVTGRVPDTRPFIAAANVVVAPLRVARGVQNKVLEAMAMARPVVATTHAFTGVQATPGRDILLANGVEETVRSVMDVLEGRHAGLGIKARHAMETGHNWSVSLSRLDELFAAPSASARTGSMGGSA